jgi:oligopeptide/dipeptide ABC transporter ATP-binding protein
VSSPAGSLLEVSGLEVQFSTDEGVVHAVDGVSFSLAPGETLAVVGESGSGKSVTALSIMGLLDGPTSRIAGHVRFASHSLLDASEKELAALRGRDIAMVFQDPAMSLNPVMRVGEQIAEAVRVHDRAVERAQAWRRAVEMLDEVGVADAATRARDFPHQLSGGMRQRVMIAMALVNRPRLLLADEPTTALDVTTQAQVLELLAGAQRSMGLALLLITHDLGVVAGVADRVVVMYAGRIVEEGPVEDVFRRAGHPYTVGLLASVPRPTGARRRLDAIAGTPPSPLRVPHGCAFQPRCPMAGAPCSFQIPPLREVGPEHRSACFYAEDVVVPLRWP